MDVRLGMKFSEMDLNKRPILIAQVYEKDGVITHAAYLEAEAMVCLLGESPLPFMEWDEAAQKLRLLCEMYRIRSVRAYIPPACLESLRPKKLAPIERILRHFGFVRETKFVAFSKWVGKE